MRTRIAQTLVGLVVIVALVVVAVAMADNGGDTQTCPDGQALSVVKVNGDTFTQSKPPPPGTHYSDTVSGSGVDYTVESDQDSATVKVHGPGTATFEVGCK